jgi:hypothetical protein
VFARIEKCQQDYSVQIRATFVEIYNEEIYDLISGGPTRSGSKSRGNIVSLREEKDGSIIMAGNTEEKIESKEQLYLLLENGSERRSTGSTKMNNESSRSHALFTLTIEKCSIQDEKDFCCAKFSFLDLAGSERLGRTEAKGSSMKEGININKGLLALGNVISALTSENGKVTFVPYRVSKLTRILSNSLGGNSRTWMIACVSPVEKDLDESINTMHYACRARKISNTPIVNKDSQSTIITQMKQQIFKLKTQVAKMRKIITQKGLDNQMGDADNLPEESSVDEVVPMATETTEETGETKNKNKALQVELMQLKEEKNKIKRELNEKNTLYLKMISKTTELRLVNQQLVSALEKAGVTDFQNNIDLTKESADETEKLIKENEGLKYKLSERNKLVQTLQDEFSKLLKQSIQENEMLVEKVKECTQLKSQLRMSRTRGNCDLSSSAISTLDTTSLNVPRFEGDETVEQIVEEKFIEEEDSEIENNYLKEKKQQALRMSELTTSLEEYEKNLNTILESTPEDEEVSYSNDDPKGREQELLKLQQEVINAQSERDEALRWVGLERQKTDAKPDKKGAKQTEQEIIQKFKNTVNFKLKRFRLWNNKWRI